MLDPKLLRESPDLVRAAIAKKHLVVDVDAVLALDAAWRAQLQEVETLRSTQKAANTAMAALPKGSPEFIAKVSEMKAVSAQVKERDVRLKEAEEKLAHAMLTLPNLPHASVPAGKARRTTWSRRRSATRPRSGRTPGRTGRSRASRSCSISRAGPR